MWSLLDGVYKKDGGRADEHTQTRIFTQVQAIARWIPTSCMYDLELSLGLSPFTYVSPFTAPLPFYTSKPPIPPWDEVYTCNSYPAEGYAWRRETRGRRPRLPVPHLHSATCRFLHIFTRLPSFSGCFHKLTY